MSRTRHKSRSDRQLVGPVVYLLLETTASNEHFNGRCDYALVTLDAAYVRRLLGLMEQVAWIEQQDREVRHLECWDAVPTYWSHSDRIQNLIDHPGGLVPQVSVVATHFLSTDPKLNPKDQHAVDFPKAHLASDELWWSACVKNSDVRIETNNLKRYDLEVLGQVLAPPKDLGPPLVHPALRQIHDLFYLELRGKHEVYNPQKSWDADTLDQIARIVAEHIPCPTQSNTSRKPQRQKDGRRGAGVRH